MLYLNHVGGTSVPMFWIAVSLNETADLENVKSFRLFSSISFYSGITIVDQRYNTEKTLSIF